MTQGRNRQMNWTELFKGKSPNGKHTHTHTHIHTHKEIFNIPGHKGNASQNQVTKKKKKPGYDSTSLLEWLSSKTQKTTNAGKDVGKKELKPCWWECKLVQPLWRAEWRFLKKLKTGYHLIGYTTPRHISERT
jgi:hypothetical protein